MFKFFLAFPLLLLPCAAAAQEPVPPPEDPAWSVPADDFVVLADDWARPRHGERVASMPSLSRAVRAWMDAGDRHIAVIYPGGETGRLWGSEIRDWLVALGVPPDAVVVRAGSPRDDAVVLRLER